MKDPEKYDSKSAEALKEKGLETDETDDPVAESEQTTNKDLPADVNDKQPDGHNDEVTKDQVKDEISEERAKVEPEGEKEESQEEEEETPIELSAAQYLALLRETEMSLFRATLNHEKVSEQTVLG